MKPPDIPDLFKDDDDPYASWRALHLTMEWATRVPLDGSIGPFAHWNIFRVNGGEEVYGQNEGYKGPGVF